MSTRPQAAAEAVLVAVAGQTVPNAETNLGAFTNITWQNTNGATMDPPPDNYFVISRATNGRKPEEPADKIGRSIPVDTAITITIAPAPQPL